jgi:hypothetical protein
VCERGKEKREREGEGEREIRDKLTDKGRETDRLRGRSSEKGGGKAKG